MFSDSKRCSSISTKLAPFTLSAGEPRNMNLTIRAAVESDAEEVASMYEEACKYLRDLGDPTDFQFSAETYRRDGFGSNPAFLGLIAALEAETVGYLLYHFGYDVDLATRIMHIVDLYVREEHRRHGAGRALMMHAQQVCRNNNVGQMVWYVYKPNQLAHEFYSRIGAKYIDDLDYMHLEVGP